MTRWQGETVHLTASETKIRDVLVSVADHLRSIHPDKPPVTLRIAGGWVRDKLLGIESHDIDIALDNMMGFEFATAVNDYMVRFGLEAAHVSKIDSNPDRSKHLETATTKVFGQLIDFVNLRTESYQEDSRIPSMEFGTPEEDALRRDITINSLFFNLHTQKVEDFTGKGLADLEAGHIRTPIDPVQTFIDDPLRVLRVIRFASRFGFTIDDAILRSTTNTQIHQAFSTKISRERIGIEVDKMLLGPDPLRSITLIAEFGFFHEVFGLPQDYSPDAASTAEFLRNALSMARAVAIVCRCDTLMNVLPDFLKPVTKEDVRLLYLAALVYPYRELSYMEKKKTFPVAKYVVMNSLKFGAVDGDWVSCMSLSVSDVRSSTDSERLEELSSNRMALGLFMRNLGTKGIYTSARPLGAKAHLVVLLSMCAELAELRDWLTIEATCSRDPNPARILEYSAVVSILGRYERFQESLRRLNVDQTYDLKPLLNGGEVANTLGIKAGPAVGVYLSKVIEWQLQNPSGSKDECQKWLVSLQP
ncbi:hypothetical protein DFJ73DRAFT_626223 [Zopfochytrium polystomum]|nr:hypothetical protein DFJ73DRAFT_626223 [Zopfochytrium polystomum]